MPTDAKPGVASPTHAAAPEVHNGQRRCVFAGATKCILLLRAVRCDAVLIVTAFMLLLLLACVTGSLGADL
jgi:hypothetical protein